MKKFYQLYTALARELLQAPVVDNTFWQSVEVSQGTHEVLNSSIRLDLEGETDLEAYRSAIGPNLPWADKHFEMERVSGEPINPGTTWREWPYALSADKHRRTGEDDPQFDHTYAERYWPKWAGITTGGYLEPNGNGKVDCNRYPPHVGIRDFYGDLDDIVTMLVREPTTRQAYLPVWFPEDLRAAVYRKRVPCSLGYHFIVRDGKINIVYDIRSCDFIRHFKDDVYLTLRLLLWVLDECKKKSEDWKDVVPGTFTMHVTSLHIFESDKIYLAKKVNYKVQ